MPKLWRPPLSTPWKRQIRGVKRTTYRLYNARYQMWLNGGTKNDEWRLTGEVWGNPRYCNGAIISPSCPVSYEEDEFGISVTTSSGNIYELFFSANKDKVIEQIKKDIAAGNYERH